MPPDTMDATTPYEEVPTQVQPLSPEKRLLLRQLMIEAKVEQAGIALAEKMFDELGVPLLSKLVTGLL